MYFVLKLYISLTYKLIINIMYKIEKNIPLAKMNQPLRIQFPFKDMEVNDSFLVPYDDENDKRLTQTRLSASASYYVSRHDKLKKFATRLQKDGVRCWRIK